MNLKNVPLEKLELLPSKLKNKHIFNSNLDIISKDYRYNRFEEDYTLTRAKLNGLSQKSIGKHHDEIYSKFIGFYKLHFYMNPRRFFNGFFNRIIITSKGFKLLGGWYNTVMSLTSLQSRYAQEYYFDEDNILRINSLEKNPRVFDAHKHYSYVTERKRKQKEYKLAKAHSIKLLQFINKPDLFEFFKRLWRDRLSLERSIRTSQNRINDSYKSKFDFTSYYKNEIKRDKIKLETVNEKIDALLKGETKIFYESEEYLYSIKKDCHHFENP